MGQVSASHRENLIGWTCWPTTCWCHFATETWEAARSVQCPSSSFVCDPLLVDFGTRFLPAVRTIATLGPALIYDELLCSACSGILFRVQVVDGRSRRLGICPWCGFCLEWEKFVFVLNGVNDDRRRRLGSTEEGKQCCKKERCAIRGVAMWQHVTASI